MPSAFLVEASLHDLRPTVSDALQRSHVRILSGAHFVGPDEDSRPWVRIPISPCLLRGLDRSFLLKHWKFSRKINAVDNPPLQRMDAFVKADRSNLPRR
jgi:hypothetical protein